MQCVCRDSPSRLLPFQCFAHLLRCLPTASLTPCTSLPVRTELLSGLPRPKIAGVAHSRTGEEDLGRMAESPHLTDQVPTPEFLKKSRRPSHGPALGSDQHSRRLTDKFQILSWNPGLARGSDQRFGCIICIQEGAGFVSTSVLAESFYIAMQHHCAVLFNMDTFAQDFSCTPLQVPLTHRYATSAVEGMVVTGKFCRAPDPSCSYFTDASIHINNECARRRSVRTALFNCPLVCL